MRNEDARSGAEDRYSGSAEERGAEQESSRGRGDERKVWREKETD